MQMKKTCKFCGRDMRKVKRRWECRFNDFGQRDQRESTKR